MVVGEVELDSCVEVAGGLYPSASSNRIVPGFSCCLTTTWDCLICNACNGGDQLRQVKYLGGVWI